MENKEFPIYGDLLEVVMSKVPLIDLVSACRVNKSWYRAILTSLLHVNKPKPWLIIRAQNTLSLAKNIIHAYDPRSDIWIEIKEKINSSEVPTLRSSSSSTLVYELSEKGLAFSCDPLHQKWYHISPPKVWRVDPIVALVGQYVIVAGGASYFEDDPLSVEMYDMETSQWSMCQSMPNILKDSTTSTWLSVASNQQSIYVTEKASGITYSFNPNTKSWSGPYDLNPDPNVFFSTVEFVVDDLILAGLIGHAENVNSLKLWKINPESESESEKFTEVSEIPSDLLEKLKGESWNFSSISLIATNNFIYIYKNSEPSVIISCEFTEGKWRWGSIKNMLSDETKIKHKMVISCANVAISDLSSVIHSRNCEFVVKPHN